MDPFFNITAFEPSKKEPIVSLIKTLVKAESSYPDAEISVNIIFFYLNGQFVNLLILISPLNRQISPDRLILFKFYFY